VAIAIKQGQQAGGTHAVTRFFPDLAFGSQTGGLAYVNPTAGECPAAIHTFFDQQNFVITKNDSAYIQFGGSVALLTGKQIGNVGQVVVGVRGQDLRRDLAEILKALNVKDIGGVRQTRLGNGLQALGPIKPERLVGHFSSAAWRQVPAQAGG